MGVEIQDIFAAHLAVYNHRTAYLGTESPVPSPYHMIVTGGGLTKEGNWRNSRKKFLLPVRVLSSKFDPRTSGGYAHAVYGRNTRMNGKKASPVPEFVA